MNANELMVGDWIKMPNERGGDNVQVENIYDKGCIASGRILLSYEIQPIPLTQEILEKNGFGKSNNVSDIPPYDKDEEGNMHYSYNDKFWGWWQPNGVLSSNALGFIELKYVHELQHVLRLCGIEKTIIV